MRAPTFRISFRVSSKFRHDDENRDFVPIGIQRTTRHIRAISRCYKFHSFFLIRSLPLNRIEKSIFLPFTFHRANHVAGVVAE